MKSKFSIGLLSLLFVLNIPMVMANGSEETTTDANGKVKLTALYVSHPLTKDLNEMKWLQEIEDEAGVDIEWEQIYADWDQTKAARFASGDIPDMLFNATAASDYTMYNGLFQELSDLIASNAPNIQTLFSEEPGTKTLVEDLEGNIYSTPKFQGKWPATNSACFINQKWLDNLGLEIPTTFTELKEVLIAFRDQDANGNGDPTDEIPMDFIGWFGGAYSLTNLIGSLGIQLTDWAPDGYVVENSKVFNYAVDERYKKLVIYLADLYKEGLINPNAITQDYGTFQSLSRGTSAGDSQVGFVYGWEETDKFGPKLNSEYTTFKPLEYDVDVPAGTYDTRWPFDYNGLNFDANRAVISALSKNKDAAMRFIDKFYSQDVSVQVLFGGISDGCVSKDNATTYTVLPPIDENTDSGTWKWTSTFADWGPMYIRRDITINMTQDMANALKEREVYAEVLAKPTDSDSYHNIFMKYTADELNQLAMLQANINNITDNYWAIWLTGDSDINADWDEYVQAVNEAGLPEVLKIRQKAFDAYLSNK